MAQPTRALTSPQASLRRYQVMAYVVGVGLVLLFFVGLPLQFAAHFDAFERVVGTIHGVFYIVYLLTVVELWLRFRLRLVDLVALVCCGWVPVMAFVVERWMTRRLKPLVEVQRLAVQPN
jgi:integral membrane protein